MVEAMRVFYYFNGFHGDGGTISPDVGCGEETAPDHRLTGVAGRSPHFRN